MWLKVNKKRIVMTHGPSRAHVSVFENFGPKELCERQSPEGGDAGHASEEHGRKDFVRTEMHSVLLVL